MFGRTLHVIDGISSRPELNGTLGLPVTYDEQKERYAVMLVSNQSRVLLKPGNLKPWLVEPAKGEPVTAVAIGTASVGKLLELIKAGAAHSQEDGIAEAVYTRALNLGGTDVRMRAELAAELYRGGGVEMLVQSMDAHMPDRRRVFFALFFVSQLLIAEEDGTERSLAAEAKERAVRAGYFDRLCAALKAHTTSDVQCTALSAFAQGASGGAFVGTEARRCAAARAGGLEAVLAAMRLAPHRSAVQHFGITALNAICATGNAVGVPPVMSRCGLAVRAGAPSLILEAMRRFGHVRSDQGVCLHRMQGPDGGEIECAVPGSILQSGCMALDCLVADDDESRIQALNDAGTLKVLAEVVRADPACADMATHVNTAFQGPPKRLAEMKVIEPLFVRLVGDSDMTSLMDEADQMTLVGTPEEPGFMLKAAQKVWEKTEGRA